MPNELKHKQRKLLDKYCFLIFLKIHSAMKIGEGGKEFQQTFKNHLMSFSCYKQKCSFKEKELKKLHS